MNSRTCGILKMSLGRACFGNSDAFPLIQKLYLRILWPSNGYLSLMLLEIELITYLWHIKRILFFFCSFITRQQPRQFGIDLPLLETGFWFWKVSLLVRPLKDRKFWKFIFIYRLIVISFLVLTKNRQLCKTNKTHLLLF